MNNILILCNDEFSKNEKNKLISKGFSVTQVSDKELKDGLDSYNYSSIVMGGDTYLSEDVLKNFTNLKHISFEGAGYNSFMDVEYCSKNNIKISNTPGVNSLSVAEFSIGLMLDIKRKISYANSLLKLESELKEIKPSTEISGLNVGIIGFGNIGSKIANICSNGFNTNVSYIARSKKESNYNFVSKEEIMKESDIIFIAVEETAETKNYITQKEFDMMKPETVIVNISRPHVVNGQDLYNALNNNKIAGFALDGYYSENPENQADKDNHKLLELDNSKFINTTHIASRTTSAWAGMDEMSIDNIIEFFKGDKEKSHIVN